MSDTTIEGTILIKISDLPGEIRESVRAVLMKRRIPHDDDLLREIATRATRAVWSCRVQPPAPTPEPPESPTTLAIRAIPPRNSCCGNRGSHGEGGREYCSTCGQGIP